jgi:hypothetical protein
MRMTFVLVFGIGLSACSGDGNEGGSASSTSLSRQSAPGPAFVNVTTDSKMAYQVGYTRPSFIRRDRNGLLTFQVLYMTIGGR